MDTAFMDTATDGPGEAVDAEAVDGPQNSPRTTARAATRQHHDERDTAEGLPAEGTAESSAGISCPEWYVL